MPKNEVLCSIFQSHHSQSDGGAVNFDNSPHRIVFSSFIDCSSCGFGGAICSRNSNAEYLQCLIYRCRSTAHSEYVYGNAIYHSQNTANMKDVSVCFSSFSTTECSDTSIYFYQDVGIINEYNASSNCGISGLTGF